MARYRRPRALSQRGDPTEPHGRESRAKGIVHENNGCSATGGAVALDYDSGGSIQVRGGDIRHKLRNPDTGENPGPTLSLGDIKSAWSRGWNRELKVAGAGELSWSHILEMRREGRVVLLQGDSGLLDGSCSEGQDVDHLVVLHPDSPPDTKRGKLLIVDPWCWRTGTKGLGKYRWIDAADIRRYAASLGYRHAWTRRRSAIG